MLIDYVSCILDPQMWNRRRAVAKIRFEFLSCRKRCSCTVSSSKNVMPQEGIEPITLQDGLLIT